MDSHTPRDITEEPWAGQKVSGPKWATTWGQLGRTGASRIRSVLGPEAHGQDGGSYLNEHEVPEHVDVPEISQAKERGEKATEQHSG